MCSPNNGMPDYVLHPDWRSSFNAWFFDTFHGYIDFITNHLKYRAFNDIQPGVVRELGAGTGANFRWLPHGCQLLALEPNAAMHQRLAANAQNCRG